MTNVRTLLKNRCLRIKRSAILLFGWAKLKLSNVRSIPIYLSQQAVILELRLALNYLRLQSQSAGSEIFFSRTISFIWKKHSSAMASYGAFLSNKITCPPVLHFLSCCETASLLFILIPTRMNLSVKQLFSLT